MSQPDAWNPAQYDQFRAERAQPFFDLLALVEPRPDIRIVDLGCGTGELTRQLHEKLAARSTLGIDNSQNMLSRATSADGLTLKLADLSTFQPDEKFDLVFSNAAIQWADNHPNLLARLTNLLTDDGQLAVQMPANDDHVTHEAARIVAQQGPFREALSGWQRGARVLPPEQYSSILHQLGYHRQHVRVQVYPHVLPDRESVIEWVRGTLLTDYQKRLPADLWLRFLEAYRGRLFESIADECPFFYPFKRLLFWAKR